MKRIGLNIAEQHGVAAILSECSRCEQELERALRKRDEVLSALISEPFLRVDVSRLSDGFLEYEPKEEPCPSAAE